MENPNNELLALGMNVIDFAYRWANAEKGELNDLEILKESLKEECDKLLGNN